MKSYTLHKIGKRQAVLTAGEDRSSSKDPIGKAPRFPNANFRGTGMALAGILKPGQSFTAWLGLNAK